MLMKTPAAQRGALGGGALAASLAALAVFAFAATPSAADLEFRAMFDSLDADGDGRVTVEEFVAPSAATGNVMVMLRAERVELTEEGPALEKAEEFWLPAVAPPDGDGDRTVREEVYVSRQVENGEVVREEVNRRPFDDEAVAGLRRMEFDRFDDDGDGAVDYAEFETRHSAMISNTYRRLDANGDGRLTGEEFDNFPVAFALGDLPAPAPDALSRESFARLDSDGDGGVSLEEFAAGGPGR